jgi:hypothetical protein
MHAIVRRWSLHGKLFHLKRPEQITHHLAAGVAAHGFRIGGLFRRTQAGPQDGRITGYALYAGFSPFTTAMAASAARNLSSARA